MWQAIKVLWFCQVFFQYVVLFFYCLKKRKNFTLPGQRNAGICALVKDTRLRKAAWSEPLFLNLKTYQDVITLNFEPLRLGVNFLFFQTLDTAFHFLLVPLYLLCVGGSLRLNHLTKGPKSGILHLREVRDDHHPIHRLKNQTL